MKVRWETLRLSETTSDGYVDSGKPLDDLILQAVKRRAGENKPVVVWIYDPENDKVNQGLESKVFYDEKVGLALKQFVCLKGDVETIPDERLMKKTRRKTPIFYFFDPAGKPFDTLTGKRATSRSGFTSRLEKLWELSYDMKLRVYAKKMSSLLDRMDKLAEKRKQLESKMARAASSPSKYAGLQKQEEKLKKAEAKLLDEEQKIFDACKLRPEYQKETAQK